MNLYLEYGGINYRVKADVTDEAVEYISKVEVCANTGVYIPVKVNATEFLETYQDQLQDAVAQARLNEKLAHEDMLFETAREEGRLHGKDKTF